jgi:hypothetical protein
MSPDAQAATIIGLGDFVSPIVLDFESLAAGPISGMDVYFTTAGISSVAVAAGVAAGDTLNTNTDGKALASVGGVLSVVDVGGAIDNGTSGGNPTFTIMFSMARTRFGYSHIDQLGNFPVSFFLGVMLVDTFTFTPGSSAPVYLEAATFDRVVISQEAGFTGGFALDNITLDGLVVVPEPATFVLPGLGLALILLGSLRRRNK